MMQSIMHIFSALSFHAEQCHIFKKTALKQNTYKYINNDNW